ncbi:putative beta-lysine N-acetyltransferase [Alkalihalophilus pseudofirmus]|uniref:Beta-lysine N-acetyltransferase n=1 Tax=Alkalihalophilus pseudofirmus TaxID=79885 RepID=A0AAJ2L1K9_ALKPS|nr:putative beta-lysine N-acetyltransferase [Alkalihalophilus pseudofirmus]MDV2885015.1 putative beta-lysine N-acetyltransferase [Alkalihalophilus pseudofirmus]
MTETVQKPSFTMELTKDDFNKRLRVEAFRGNVDDVAAFLLTEAKSGNYEKVIVQSAASQWQAFLRQGFELEGVLEGFFNGSDAHVMTFYTTDARRTSSAWQEEQDILKAVQQKYVKPHLNDLPLLYQLRKATEVDAEALAHLYKTVFPVYPTPMDQPEYVRKMMAGGSLFCVTEYEGTIISAASADVNETFHHAELTDCATLPEHRAHGLMKHLLMKLEEELKEKCIYCAFSLARAKSFGMNDAFFQLGYAYGGRLTNNCYIFEDLEDMNIWVKDLSQN